MTDDEVLSAAVRWVAAITGIQTIKAHQSEDRPTLPYCMVNLTDIAPVRVHSTDIEFADTGNPNGEVDAEGEPINEIEASPVMHTEWRLMVTAYGGAPTTILRPLRSAIELGQKVESLHPLVIHEVGRVQDVPEWANNAWEQRAIMTLFLHGYTRDGFVIDVIDEAPVTLTRAH